MKNKESIRALFYLPRARHVRALDFEYILSVESGDDKIPRVLGIADRHGYTGVCRIPSG
jgi:hypothetical protein